MAVEMNQEWRAVEEYLKYWNLPHKLIDSVVTAKGRTYLVYDDKHFRCFHMTFKFNQEKGWVTLVDIKPLVEEK